MPQAFKNEVTQLRQQFIQGLPQRAHQLEDLWHRLRYLNWSEQGIKTLHKLIHHLVGSCTSFGLPEISVSACILDKYLQEHRDLDQSLGGIEREMIESMLINVVHLLNQNNHLDDMTIPTLHHTINTHKEKRIYIIDDDHALVALITAYLRASGYEAQAFDDAAACIPQLSTHAPHAILMDVGLHGEGLQSIDAIENIKTYIGNTIPIILLSARSDIHARLRALRAGCTEYLTKPIDFFQLVDTLSNLIHTHSPTQRVMIIDEDEPTAQHHADILRGAGMEVQCVAQTLQSLQKAIEFKPDLVIIDKLAPNINSAELATLLRQEEQFVILPIIFFSSNTDAHLQSDSPCIGINAIQQKPVQPEEFIQYCKNMIGDTAALKNRISRVTQRGSYQHQITRSYFFSAIENELQQQPFRMLPSALYYIGIENMEEIQEHYGQTGITILHEQYCKHMAKNIGADEQWVDISNLIICVLAGPRTEEQHKLRTEHILNKVNKIDFSIFNDTFELRSNTVISYLNAGAESANEILQNAASAFDEVKSKHTNITHASQQQKPLLNIFSHKFTNELPLKHLSLAYQPMITLEEYSVDNHEILIRWKTEEDELIPAAKFLHHIEQSAMRIELDRWILETAINAIVQDNHTRESANLFIHLAEETLEQKTFLYFAANVLHNSRLRGTQRLIFMLEETWIATKPQLATDIIQSLRDIHCGICLSHAGASSNTDYILNNFHFDYLKLSPRLTAANATADQESVLNLKKITTIANNLKIKMIAAQVEDSKNIASLWLLGIRLFQGFSIQTPDQHFHTHNDIDFAQATAFR